MSRCAADGAIAIALAAVCPALAGCGGADEARSINRPASSSVSSVSATATARCCARRAGSRCCGSAPATGSPLVPPGGTPSIDAVVAALKSDFASVDALEERGDYAIVRGTGRDDRRRVASRKSCAPGCWSITSSSPGPMTGWRAPRSSVSPCPSATARMRPLRVGVSALPWYVSYRRRAARVYGGARDCRAPRSLPGRTRGDRGYERGWATI